MKKKEKKMKNNYDIMVKKALLKSKILFNYYFQELTVFYFIWS